MEKDHILSVILIILSIIVFVLLCIYSSKYNDEYQFQSFMLTFERKLNELSYINNKDKIRYAFKSVFHRYTDSTGLNSFLQSLKILFIDFAIFTGLVFMSILQLECPCKGENLLKSILSIISVIITFGITIVYIVYAFQAKYKIELNDEEIYIFDAVFNEEVRRNINLAYDRRVYMITCVLLADFIMICQIILIFVNYKCFKSKKSIEIYKSTLN